MKINISISIYWHIFLRVTLVSILTLAQLIFKKEISCQENTPQRFIEYIFVPFYTPFSFFSINHLQKISIFDCQNPACNFNLPLTIKASAPLAAFWHVCFSWQPKVIYNRKAQDMVMAAVSITHHSIDTCLCTMICLSLRPTCVTQMSVIVPVSVEKHCILKLHHTSSTLLYLIRTVSV